MPIILMATGKTISKVGLSWLLLHNHFVVVVRNIVFAHCSYQNGKQHRLRSWLPHRIGQASSYLVRLIKARISRLAVFSVFSCFFWLRNISRPFSSGSVVIAYGAVNKPFLLWRVCTTCLRWRRCVSINGNYVPTSMDSQH